MSLKLTTKNYLSKQITLSQVVATLHPGNCSLPYEECSEDNNIHYLVKKGTCSYIYIYIHIQHKFNVGNLYDAKIKGKLLPFSSACLQN